MRGLCPTDEIHAVCVRFQGEHCDGMNPSCGPNFDRRETRRRGEGEGIAAAGLDEVFLDFVRIEEQAMIPGHRQPFRKRKEEQARI